MSERPEDVAAREAYLNLVRAHEKLHAEFSALFKAHDLTQPQYNVLRILLDAPKEGVPCQGIGERLLNRVPDVTRLVDRMESAGLVRRTRCPEDRRVVRITVTPKGRKRCEGLNGPVMDLHREQAAHLAPKRVAALNKVLREFARL